MIEKYQARVVRVFISSTFRDMHGEREELVKYTFPELRRRCRERGVEFVDVDLRWGVTEEQSERGEVLPICLAEIERCHPYFIGLLGERYGWVPEEIDQEIIKGQPWLEEYKEKSVTELEIIHGVLENEKMDKCSYFYLRDEETSRRIETALSKEQDYRPEPDHFQHKLKSLKESISEYPNRSYADVKTLGQQVLDDLWVAIDKQFPESETPTELEKTRLEHEAFAAVRRNVYIEKQKYFDRLDEHVTSDEPPLVILGESGSGKSALIANWVEGYREKHPDDFILMHFIGSSADSADYVSLLRRIMLEIKARTEPEQKKIEDSSGTVIPFRRLDEEEEMPTDPQKIVEAFPLWLSKAAAKGRFILVLDGLNQLEDRDNALDLTWLPKCIPPQVRLIVSTLPGRSLDALQKRDWPHLDIELLDTQEGDTQERKDLIKNYLNRFSKTLDENQVKRITISRQSRNPLYLKTLLDELRVFGSYEKLNERIDYYLQAETIDALFDRMLERLEQDYDREHSGLTREIMSLIWASRHGLSETELLEMLDIPQATWSPLKLAVEESLVSRSGLLNFFHDFLRQAIQQRYLEEPKQQKAAHLDIADYFQDRELEQRKIEELPWQLLKAESWERLKDCITEPAIFLELQTDKFKYELTGYWLGIGDQFDMVESYQASITRHEKANPDVRELSILLNQIALFLILNAKFESSEPLLRKILEIDEAAHGLSHRNVANRLTNLAELLYITNRYKEAEPLFRRALAIHESIYGPDYPTSAVTLNNLASLLNDTNRHSEAEPLFRRALEINEATYGTDSPEVATVLNNLAGMLRTTNHQSEAESLIRRALKIDEGAYGPDHPQVAIRLNTLGGLLYETNRHTEAEPLYRRALKIDEGAYGPDHPKVAIGLNNLGGLLLDTTRHSEAEPLYRRALEIDEGAYGPDHPQVSIGLNNLGGLLCETNRHSEAEPLYRRSLEISEASHGLDHPDIAIKLNNLAGLMRDTNRHTEAEPLYRRALAVDEGAYGPDHPQVAAGLTNLGGLLIITNRHSEAEPLIRRALKIDEESYGPDHYSVAIVLSHLAGLLYFTKRYSEAEPLYGRALEISEATYGPDHFKGVNLLSDLAELLKATDRHSEAEPLIRRALKIEQAAYGAGHPNVAIRLHQLGGVMIDSNRHSEAGPLFCQALKIDEEAYGPDHPKVAIRLSNLVEVMKGTNRPSEAEPLLRRALEINQAAYGSDHPNVAKDLSSLAELLVAANRCSEAEPLFRRALNIDEAHYGPNHPKVAWDLSYLGGLLMTTNRHSEAEPLFRRALDIIEAVYGVDHPHLVGGLHNLAGLLNVTNRHTEAEPLFRRVLKIREKILGGEHPDTAASWYNLAFLLFNMGKGTAAVPYYENAIAIYEDIVGRIIPSTPQLNSVMAICHNQVAFHGCVPSKNWSEAENHYRRAIVLFNESKRPPEAANTELNLLVMFQLSGQTVDWERVEELIQILEQADDKRAEKGRDLLK